MAGIRIELLGDGACRVEHESSGTVLLTDTTPEYGGKGRSFSSTDLVAVALGTCIATSIEPVLRRMGIEPGMIRMEVSKELARRPKGIARLDVLVFVPRELIEIERRKIRNAARSCAVKRSLGSSVVVDLDICARRSV